MKVIVIGAGIAGLVAAARLAREGHAVTVLERAGTLGGRAATTEEGGYHLNLGPHALYTAGATARALADLGVTVRGHDPGVGGHVLHRGALHALPGTPWSFLTTSLLGVRGQLQIAGFVRRLLFADPAALERVPVATFLAPIEDPAAAALALAFVRLFTYANDPGRQSAGAVVRQMRLGLRSGVLYLDGGWGTIVEGLRAVAVAAGAVVRTGADVTALDGTTVSVGGEALAADAVIVATPLPAARRLLPELPEAPAVRAACLDLALAPGAAPKSRFVLGADRPLYLSIHSETARLAPDGGAVVHVAHYLAPGEHADVAELEALADRAIPDWRSRVVTRRWLPALTVASALHLAERPRPGVSVRPGVFVAGDWVGAEGELVDTSAASAWAAAEAVIAAAGRQAQAA